MKPKGILIGVGAVAAAVALTVFSSGPFSTAVQAKGPSVLQFDAALNNGGAIGGVGTAIPVGIDVRIDAPGNAPNPAPSDVAFFDSTITNLTSVAPAAGPTTAASLKVGAKAGAVSFTIQTNQDPLLLPKSISPAFNYEVPKCGDSTRNYNGTAPSPTGGLRIAANPFEVWAGNMANVGQPTYLFASDAGFSLATFQAQHPVQGASNLKDTGWIQSYDDDNNNGIPDGQEPGVGTTAEPIGAGGAGHDPLYNNAPVPGASTTYLKSTPQTQHDYDGNGLPNGIEYMPDYLPQLVDSLGLSAFWNSRSYGVATTFAGQVPGTDVHFLGFKFPDGSSTSVTSLTNPYSSSNPINQRTVTCTPFFTSVKFDASTTAPDYNGDGDQADGPETNRTVGDPVNQVTVAGGGSINLTFSDFDDNDQDGIASPYDLCGVSSVNTDADSDLVSGSCDVKPTLADNTTGPAFMHEGTGDEASCFDGLDNAPTNGLIDFADPACGNGTIYDNDVDGDGWINDVDNCPTVSNPEQFNKDSDTVGDACDNLITTDTLTGNPSGAGDGTAASNTLDNDATCVDSYTTSEGLTTDATCSPITDANDDGVADPVSYTTDEDGDGYSDACETAALTGGADTDGDKLPNACEDVNNNGIVDAGETDPNNADTDGDGVKDGLEVADGTNPLVNGGYTATDTDGDGCKDSSEITKGTNPGYFWDFFDVGTSRGATSAPGDENFTPDGKINFSDVLITLDHFGHDATQAGKVDAFDPWMDRVNRKAAADTVLRPAGFGLPAPIDRGVGATLPLVKTLMFEQEKSITFTDVLAALDGFGGQCTGADAGLNIVNPITGAGIPNLGGIH